MAKIYGQLERAAFEVLSSNPAAGITGRFLWNSTEGKAFIDDATNVYAFLRNDAKAIIGNNGTANNNIRFHRGASGVLQFVQGGDATAEGTLSTALNQISARVENYLDASKPAFGNAGRLAWITDKSILKVDTGSAWVPVGSGGGGGSLKWVEDAEAPIPTIENQFQLYLFESGLAQKLYTLIKVPTSYVAGSPITLKMSYYSPDTSNTALLQTVATLIGVGTAVTSTANQRTSTNSAVTLDSPADENRTVSFDLTSSTGEINSVAVAPGDLIQVQLTRGTDTSTSDIRALVYGAEVTFS